MVDLKQVANGSEVTKAIFKHFSTRQRYRKSTNIPYLQMKLRSEGQEFAQKDLIEAFKVLSEAKLGTVVHGRGKSPTRFIWNYNLKDIALVAQGTKTLEEAQIIKVERAKRQAKTIELFKPENLGTNPNREKILAAMAEILAYLPK